ncbi:MAG TPA: amphi-Trp domain-containing protein [Tepidisphaeraceae bacterium]|nr:amphi-Trp domain-containing protein [Tepidisphaeraceae bacterium]
MARKRKRDIEKTYPRKQFIAKLRRWADALETGQPFTIQVAGEVIRVPARAVFNIEHEREGQAEEVEFQMKWELDQAQGKAKPAAAGRRRRPM